jgi:fatty acid desaturase
VTWNSSFLFRLWIKQRRIAILFFFLFCRTLYTTFFTQTSWSLGPIRQRNQTQKEGRKEKAAAAAAGAAALFALSVIR